MISNNLIKSNILIVAGNISTKDDKTNGIIEEDQLEEDIKNKIDIMELKKDLVNLPVSVVCEKYSITLDELFEACKTSVYDNNKKENDKYISRKNKMFKVSRLFGRERISFGIYKRKEDARLVRDALVNENWDEDKLPEILDKLGIKDMTPK